MSTDAAVGHTCWIYCTGHLRIVDHDRSHTDCWVTYNSPRPVYEHRRTWDGVDHIDAAGCSFDSCKMLHIAGTAGCTCSNSHMDSQPEMLDLGAFVGKVGFVDQR